MIRIANIRSPWGEGRLARDVADPNAESAERPARRTAVALPRANGAHGDSQGQRLGFVNAKPICPNEATCVGSMYHSPPEGIVGTLRQHRTLLLNWFPASEEIFNGSVELLNSKSKLPMKGPTVSNPIKRLKSPWLTSWESFLSQIKPTDSAVEIRLIR